MITRIATTFQEGSTTVIKYLEVEDMIMDPTILEIAKDDSKSWSQQIKAIEDRVKVMLEERSGTDGVEVHGTIDWTGAKIDSKDVGAALNQIQDSMDPDEKGDDEPEVRESSKKKGFKVSSPDVGALYPVEIELTATDDDEEQKQILQALTEYDDLTYKGVTEGKIQYDVATHSASRAVQIVNDRLQYIGKKSSKTEGGDKTSETQFVDESGTEIKKPETVGLNPMTTPEQQPESFQQGGKTYKKQIVQSAEGFKVDDEVLYKGEPAIVVEERNDKEIGIMLLRNKGQDEKIVIVSPEDLERLEILEEENTGKTSEEGESADDIENWKLTSVGVESPVFGSPTYNSDSIFYQIMKGMDNDEQLGRWSAEEGGQIIDFWDTKEEAFQAALKAEKAMMLKFPSHYKKDEPKKKTVGWIGKRCYLVTEADVANRFEPITEKVMLSKMPKETLQKISSKAHIFNLNPQEVRCVTSALEEPDTLGGAMNVSLDLEDAELDDFKLTLKARINIVDNRVTLMELITTPEEIRTMLSDHAKNRLEEQGEIGNFVLTEETSGDGEGPSQVNTSKTLSSVIFGEVPFDFNVEGSVHINKGDEGVGEGMILGRSFETDIVEVEIGKGITDDAIKELITDAVESTPPDQLNLRDV